MSGDYSRERFQAQRNVASVRMQQGRVQLDSDWNELVDVVDRRFRTETVDLVARGPVDSPGGVAVYPRLTPDAFRIGISGGTITIGRGRMYVDGLLAENHGTGPLEFDRILAEERGTQPITYETQPHLPAPPDFARSGRALAYLDVWHREVTHLQDPGLVENAVGVDTTTRLQTVWQVRLLGGLPSSVTCSTADEDIPGWLDLIRPSGARLTTRAVGVPEDEDPCEMPPAGGFRGVENQLYRIQIHNGGSVGQATFKWSRDNASVASGVVEVISPHELRLESLGRDSVLRFNTGDWVEIIDDRRELTGIGGDPSRRHGEIRQIVTDEATRTITFAPDLPADLVPGGAGTDTADARHLLVRRWDQSGTVHDADGDLYFNLDDASPNPGVIPVPPAGTTLMLESGIQVTFSLAEDGEFHSGDYWTVAARTADASVEELDEAPPRGTHHHFARLGVVSFPAEVQDCRVPWPPDIPVGEGGCNGSCTISICVEQFVANPNIIQEAVDSLRQTGGTICLGAGVFPLGERRVVIEGAQSITIHGQGTATMLAAFGTVFEVRQSFMIAIEDLAITVVTQSLSPAIMIDQVVYGRYARLAITHNAPAGDGEDVPAIGMSRIVYLVDIKECLIAGRTGVGYWFAGRDDNARYVMTDGLQITDNYFSSTQRGIHLEGQVLYGGDVQAVRNRFTGSEVAAITLVGASVPQTRVEITDNVIAAGRAGIVAGVNGLRVDRNEVTTGGAGADGRTASSIGILLRPGFDQTPIGPVSISANHVRHVTGPGIAVSAMLTTSTIADNVVRDTEAGIVFAGAGGAASAHIRGNTILETDAHRAQGQLVTAIRAQRVRDLQVTENTIVGVGGPQTTGFVMGVLTAGCLDVSVTDNHISELSVGGEAALAGGIVVGLPFAHAEVSQNIVRGDLSQEMQDLAWTGIVIGASDITGAEVQRFGDEVSTVRTTASRTVMMSAGHAAVFEVQVEHAAAHENVVEGGLRYPVLAASVRGELLMSHNRCLSGSSSGPVVFGVADIASVHGNRVRGGEVSVELMVDSRRSTFTGNITSGAFRVAGAPLAAPWSALNVNG
jgi:hypothetical protein